MTIAIVGAGGFVGTTLIESLVTTAEPKNRDVEAARAKARSAARFGT